MFCYLTDLEGNYQLYHDANEWPTVLAPVWGFCSVQDAVWQNTLTFAFSVDNTGGYYPGEFGGLSSVHTTHPWPLGDLQELFLAKTPDEVSRIWNKLAQVSSWDGNFSEAYSEQNGEIVSRHWFAWPSAMLVQVLAWFGRSLEEKSFIHRGRQ